MRLLSYNVRYGGVGRESAIGAVIRACAPDLVILQEATVPASVRRIAGDAGLDVWESRAGYSLGFIARQKPMHHEWHWLRSARHASLHVDFGQDSPLVVGVHLRAVHANWTERRRVADAEALLASLAPFSDRPHIVVGDFNSLAPGAALHLRSLPARLWPFIWMSGGRIRWRAIARMAAGGYADAFRAKHPDDAGFTFPTHAPHVRLDYAFVPERLMSAILDCQVVRDPRTRAASDHFPLLVDIGPPRNETQG